MKQYYYHWWLNKQEYEYEYDPAEDQDEDDYWCCSITPKEYFDKEGHLDDRGGILDKDLEIRKHLCESMESEFQRCVDSSLSIDEIKKLMAADPHFLSDPRFSDFVDECNAEEFDSDDD
jgi:hypothetical protein